MRTFIRVGLLLLIPLAAVAIAGETARVGGSGGTKTVRMDCGPGAFMVGVWAEGGRDNPIGFNLVRRLRFTCRAFSGTTPGNTVTQTPEAAGTSRVTANVSRNQTSCASSMVLTSLDLYAGTYIDRLAAVDCRDGSGNTRFSSVNVGGEGGQRSNLQCPSGEGLYRVDARVGAAIDSLKGYCRPFVSLSSTTVVEQASASLSPKPTLRQPVKIMPGRNATFSFKISNAHGGSPVEIGISARTDLLGFAGMNPPEFRLEVLNPSGRVVASDAFRNTREGVIESVRVTINATGTWKLRVTNLKRTTGALEVLSVRAIAR